MDTLCVHIQVPVMKHLLTLGGVEGVRMGILLYRLLHEQYGCGRRRKWDMGDRIS